MLQGFHVGKTNERSGCLTLEPLRTGSRSQEPDKALDIRLSLTNACTNVTAKEFVQGGVFPLLAHSSSVLRLLAN